MREQNAERRLALDEQVVSREDRDDATNSAAAARAEYQQAQAQLQIAELNLRRTRVLAPVDGYVTNLGVRPGDYAEAGAAQLAVVDRHSYWVYGYFEETKLPLLRVGDAVEMQLMSGQLLEGHIDSIARAIYDRDNPQSRELIADVNPTFNWVRLAQRVPVRIHIDEVPEGVLLAAGITATVIVNPEQREAVAAVH
ncbi:p-hydroxybenzoic acid efflux pump subunit AaeA [compost metagenome]